MGYRFLAADVDGTLVPSGGDVSENTLQWIRRAFREGRIVTLATGRLPAAADRFRRLLPGPAPLILGNGAVLMDSLTGTILWERLFDPPDALAAMEWGQTRGRAMLVWTREGLFIQRPGDWAREYTRRSPIPPRLLESLPRAAAQGVYKILVLGDPEDMARAMGEILAAPPAPLNAFTSDACILEIVPAGVDKGAGLEAAANLLGIPLSETIAVGDGFNDLPMIRRAGLGCAMANAPEAVQRQARLIVPSCRHDGVAWLIRHRLLEP